MSAEFKIAETDSFRQKIQNKEFRVIYDKILSYVYPQLKANPFYGPNIKKLKGEFSSVYRYRIGNIRLFYSIDKNRINVFIINVSHRKDNYKKKK